MVAMRGDNSQETKTPNTGAVSMMSESSEAGMYSARWQSTLQGDLVLKNVLASVLKMGRSDGAADYVDGGVSAFLVKWMARWR
eukprot:12551134-Alexandrium_andersonii.AAC.1